MSWLLLAGTVVCLLIGAWWELECGSARDSTLRRLRRIAAYSVLWLPLAIAALWCWATLPDDLESGP